MQITAKDKGFSTCWHSRTGAPLLVGVCWKALRPWHLRLSMEWDRRTGRITVLCGLVSLLATTNGCLTFSRPLPPVSLTEPGWIVHQGQAVWRLPGGKHDIAGDVLVAIGPERKSFVQFSKSPFPLVIGQTTSNRWQVEFPPQNKHYSGPGFPPKRLIWLYLPSALEGKTVPHGWAWTNSESNWRLENRATGERLDGFFAE